MLRYSRALIGCGRQFLSQYCFTLGQFYNAKQINFKPVLSVCQSNARPYSSESTNLPKVHFEELRSFQNDKNIVIIDVREPNELVEYGVIEGSINIPHVREPNELVEYGVIEGSINIPLGEVEQTLKLMSNEEFQKKYSRLKPDLSSPIIFSCQRGMRSEKAQIMAQQLGYVNVKNYIGGWLDWAEKIKSIK